MINTAIASLALFGTSALAGSYGDSAASVRGAHVVNNCDYPIKLCSVPASGGGYEQEEKTLAPGDTWYQLWTQLTNLNGWSIKLSKSDNKQSQVLQYEYTYLGDGKIWYDVSFVDGNPWQDDWAITANGSDCAPKQQAYRYSTDDTFGMQSSCSQDSAITVTVCTGPSADNGAASAGSPPPAESSPAVSAPAYEPIFSSAASAPAIPSTASAPVPTGYGYNWNNQDAAKSEAAAAAPAPTTFAKSVAAAGAGEFQGVTVTEVETVFATAAVTAYVGRLRRHVHGHGHTHHE